MSDDNGVVALRKDNSVLEFTPFMRRLPHNVDAEMALLGALLLNNSIFEKLPDRLQPQHFVLKEHGRIFGACQQMRDRGKLADPVTMKEFFASEVSLSGIGGVEYMTKLCDCAATPINAREYGQTVYDLYIRRTLIALCEDAISAAYSAEMTHNPERIVDELQENLFALGSGTPNAGFVQAGALLDGVFAEAAKALQRRKSGVDNGIKTGLTALDRIIGGFRAPQYIVIAGRPSMGKTTLACNIAYNIASAFKRKVARPDEGKSEELISGGRVAFISLENSSSEIVRQNIIARACDIPGEQLLDPDPEAITEAMLSAASEAAHAKVARMPLAICDSAGTLAAIRKALRHEKKTNGLDVAIVDYLGLVDGDEMDQKQRDSFYAHVTRLSKGFKKLAKDLNIPIIVLCQLNRSLESRDNKRPQLSDLRETGAVEQDADRVIFVYRDEYYLARQEPDPSDYEAYDKWQSRMMRVANKMEAIVAKNRMGRIGTAELYYKPEIAFVGNLDRSGQ